MRSLKLCLLVLLTSCMLDTINASMETEFCHSDKSSVEDCDNKADTHKDDFSWTVASSFGNQKKVPEHEEEYVEIDMHRALYVSIDNNGQTLSNVKFKSNDEKQCQLYFKRTTGTTKYNSLKPTFAGSSILTSTALEFSTSFSKGETTLLAVLDPKCRVYAQRKSFNGASLFHVFLRNLETGKLDETVYTDVSDSSAGKITLNLGHFIYSKKKGSIEGNIGTDIIVPNTFFSFPELPDSFEECNHQCKHGSRFDFHVLKDGTTFANKFKMSKTCEWMSIYLSKNKTSNREPAEISLRHGFVKLPQELKVYAMDFEAIDAFTTPPASGPVTPPEKVYEVNVMYSLKKANPSDSTGTRQLDISNSHGRAVRSYAMRGNSDTISFTFSHDNCLVNVIGSEFEVNADKSYAKGFEFYKDMNLGHKVALQHDKWKAIRYAKASSTDEKYNKPVPSKFDALTEDQPITIDYREPVVYTTTTGMTLSPNSSHEQQTAATAITLDKADLDKIEEDRKRKEAYEKRVKEISEGKYYFYWAIPAGFAAGSFGTFIICNILLFIFNRSVLTFWYKAMYKRYGSDTTMGAGTTMGKTVGGETIGGGTTMGGTTAGGETTQGSTTAA